MSARIAHLPRRWHAPWTVAMDVALLEAVAAGQSRRAAAAALGVTRSAAIARWKRLTGRHCPSDLIRRAKRNLQRWGAT